METHQEGNITLHQVAIPHREYNYADTPSKLEEWDVKYLAEKGIVEAWYWYGTGDYCGDGELIGKTLDGRWYSVNMSHCSCYGPTSTSSGDFFDTLEQLRAYPYKDRLADMQPVLDAIK